MSTINVTVTKTDIINVQLKGVPVVSAANFVDLVDTPASYIGQTGKSLVVNNTENGLVFGNQAQVSWGDLVGVLTDQTDLQNALDLKFNSTDFSSQFDTVFNTKTTSNLSEGTNLYYTETRVTNNSSVQSNTAHRNIVTGNPHNVTLSEVGGTTDHTELTNIGTNSHTQIDSFISSKGAINGLASLDAAGLVPSSQLPSYVDDVLEFASVSAFPDPGETGKIYVALDTDLTYRWSGTVYVELTDTTAIWGNVSGDITNQTDLQNALGLKTDETSFQTHVTDKTNPHVVTHAQLTDTDTDGHVSEIISYDNSDSGLSSISVKTALDELDAEKVRHDELASNLFFYPTTSISDIGGYSKMVTSITDPDFNSVAVNVATAPITGAEQLISSLATDVNVLVGNPGIINITTVGNIRKVSGNSTAEFYYKIYHRDNLGNETLVATSSVTNEIIEASFEQFYAIALLNNGEFLVTDRIVIKYYANKIGTATAPVYEFQFGGESPVRSLFPIPLNVAVIESKDIIVTPDLYAGVLNDTADVEKALIEVDKLSIATSKNGFDREAPTTMGDLSFAELTRTFTIEPQSGQDNFIFWSNSRRYVKNSAENLVFSDTSGLKIIYYDQDGVLQTTSAAYVKEIFLKHAIVSVIYWDAVNSKFTVCSDERHGVNLDSWSHYSDHINIGAIYYSGLGINGLSVGSSVYTSTDAGVIFDEDIQNDIDIQTVSSFWYLEGTVWTADAASLTLAKMGTTYTNYNLIGGGVGSQVEIGNNNFVLVHILATNCTFSKMVKVQGQNEYTKIADARIGAAEEVNNLVTVGLPTPEFVFIGTVILDKNGEVVLNDLGTTFVDWRQSGISSGTAPSSHQNLTDKDIDGHPANVVTYDNTTSGLPAIETQSAIDAVNAKITGATGTFTTADSKTVTVVEGLITLIL